MEKEKEKAPAETEDVLIRTPNLLIRRFGQEEWPELLTYLQDDGVADGFPEGIYTEERLRDMTADPYLYALVSLQDDQVIGHVFSRPGVQPMTGLLGFGVRSDYRRCGYGTEAAQALFRHAFEELGLHRVTVSCPPENLALRALLEKCGMRMEAFFRRNLPTIDGEWRDECVYALLRDEWLVNASLLHLRQGGESIRLEDFIALSLSAEREQSGAGELVEAVPVLDTALAIEAEQRADLEAELEVERQVDLERELEAAYPTEPEREAEYQAELELEAAAGFEREEVASYEAPAQTSALPEAASDAAVEAAPVLPVQEPAADAAEESAAESAAEHPAAPEMYGQFAAPGEPEIPQVTLPMSAGDSSGAGPSAPVLPAAVAATVIEPAAVEGTVVGVQRAPAAPDPMYGLIEQRVDGVPVVLRRLHDFNWLAPFGRVFRVWDRQDSGNLSFGLEIEDQRVFIKYAGAETAEYAGHPADAVQRLREAANAYEALDHPALVRMLDHFETPDGYAILFEWAKGQSLHRGDDSGADPHPVRSRFRALPIERRLEAMETILDFHAHVEEKGYVAIDFYDGSMLYDFEAGRMTLCDIDLYRPVPYINEMGRMWGSSRFMSAEEYELGAAIDSRTNVYTMGATAFYMLGGTRDRSPGLWEAGEELYRLALRAVSPERSHRQASVRELLDAWTSLLRG